MTIAATGERLDEIAAAFELVFGMEGCSEQNEQ